MLIEKILYKRRLGHAVDCLCQLQKRVYVQWVICHWRASDMPHMRRPIDKPVDPVVVRACYGLRALRRRVLDKMRFVQGDKINQFHCLKYVARPLGC
jgi:hypothetical protein